MEILLLITVLVPLAGGVLLFLSPRLDYRQARSIALGTALAALALTAVLMLAFKPGLTTPQFAFGGPNGPYGFRWLGADQASIRFALGLDGLSVGLFGLTSLLLITAIFASWESVKERPALHYAFLLSLETGLLGLFSSLDVVLFYIFFEFTLIPLFFLIGIWGGPERRRASITFFLYTLAGSLLTLLGVIALVAVHYQYSPTHTLTFSIPELTSGLSTLGESWKEWAPLRPTWTSPQVLIFLLLFAGFAIKVPMFPFHTWLPLAHVEAPTAGSILLAGVLLKVGSYGLTRFNMAMTPVGARFLFPLLAALAVAGIIYGALAALAQTDVKRLIAYSSVSHMGFVALGLFSMTTTGMNGASAQMINHGLTTGALFACIGIIYERYHTREMSEMGGLWKRLPLFAFFFILSSMGSAALPGLNGFVGEFPILVGTYATSPWSAVLASIGMILGAYYLLWMLQRVVFGPLHEPHGHGHGNGEPSHHAAAGHGGADAHAGAVRPVGWHEIAGLTPLMVLIVLIGVYPAPIFDRTRPTVASIRASYQKLEDAEDAAQNPMIPRRSGSASLSPAPQPTTPTAGTLTRAEIKGR